MALINCPECGKRVSSYALNCPDCGYPINKEKLDNQIDDSVINDEQINAEIDIHQDVPSYTKKKKGHGKVIISWIVILSLFAGLLYCYFTYWNYSTYEKIAIGYAEDMKEMMKSPSSFKSRGLLYVSGVRENDDGTISNFTYVFVAYAAQNSYGTELFDIGLFIKDTGEGWNYTKYYGGIDDTPEDTSDDLAYYGAMAVYYAYQLWGEDFADEYEEYISVDVVYLSPKRVATKMGIDYID